MGLIDRVIRMLFAAVVAVLFFTDKIKGIPAIILIIFAGIFVLTSLVGFCPLYKLFGINSGKK